MHALNDFLAMRSEDLARIDDLCEEYELAWRRGNAPPLRHAIEGMQGKMRSVLLRELLGIERHYRSQSLGRIVGDDEIIRANQSLAEEINRELLQLRTSETETVDTTQSEVAQADSSAEQKSPINIQFDKLPVHFGRYRIIRRLGSGGMGSVYLAEDSQLERRVAIKLPHHDVTNDSQIIDRFFREAKVAAALNHPRLCAVYDMGKVDGLYYLSMEYIDGQPLSSIILSDKTISDDWIVSLIRKMAMALQEAHEHGIVHRDLKPSNVMINRCGEPVITDFGLAQRRVQQGTRLTHSGVILGTPAYMSPEQVDGDLKRMGPASDIYSLGVILYELLTRKLPFQGSAAAVIGQIMTQDPTPISTHRPDVDPVLEAVCNKMIAKCIEDRFGSMREVAERLANWLQAEEATVAQDSRGQLVAADRARAAPMGTGLPPTTKWRIAGFFVALIVFCGVVVFVRTSEGTFRVESNDPQVRVLLDNEALDLTDGSWTGNQDVGMHRLDVMIGETRLPLGETTTVVLDGKKSKVRLSVSGIKLIGDRFEIARNGETSATIRIQWLEPQQSDGNPVAGVASEAIVSPTTVGTKAAAHRLHSIPLTKTLEIPQRQCLGMLLTPDEQQLAFLNYGSIRFWDRELRTFVSEFKNPLTEKEVFELETRWQRWALHRQTNMLALAGNGHVSLFDLKLRRIVWTVQPFEEWVASLAFSEDGNLLLVVSFKSDDARTLDVATGDVKQTLPTTKQTLATPVKLVYLGASFVPDQDAAILAGNGPLELWSLRSKTKLRDFKGHDQHSLAGPEFVDAQTFLTGHRDGAILMWDIAKDVPLHKFSRHSGEVLSIKLLPDNDHFVSGSTDGTLRMWSHLSRRQVAQCTIPPDAGRLVEIASDGKTVYSIRFSPNADQPFLLYEWNTVEALSAERQSAHPQTDEQTFGRPAVKPAVGHNGQPWSLFRTLEGHEHIVQAVRFDQSSQELISGSYDATMKLWNVATGECLRTFQPMVKTRGANNDHFLSVAVSPDGETIATAHGHPGFHLWDRQSGKEIDRIEHGEKCYAVDFNPNGSLLAVACYRQLIIWDVERQMTRSTLAGHRGSVLQVTFFPQGDRLATLGVGSEIKIWDSESGRCLRTISVKKGSDLESLAVSADGARLAGGGKSGVIIWKLTDGTVEQHLKENSGIPIHSLDFSADGRLLVSGDRAGIVRVWNTDTAKLVADLKPTRVSNGRSIRCVAFSPDSRLLAVARANGQIQLRHTGLSPKEN